MQPLTHHQIIGLVEPFTRRGRHVDLGASNRLERCIVFKPVDNADGTPSPSGLRETLKLENPYDSFYRLTRGLHQSSGLAAHLTAEGADAGELLQRIDAVAPQRQFSAGTGFQVGLSFRLESAPPSVKMILTDAVANVAGFSVTMRVPRTTSMAAEIELAAPDGSAVTLPEDLLAVIGWDWSPLRVSRARKELWTSKVRLRGKEPQRSASAEIKLDRTVRHLVSTLSRPPSAFHEQHAAARWGAAFRRGIPLLAAAGLIGGATMLPRSAIEGSSPLRMMVFNLPTLLLALAFSMQELPRFEIPPWPRRLKDSAWPAPPPDNMK